MVGRFPRRVFFCLQADVVLLLKGKKTHTKCFTPTRRDRTERTAASALRAESILKIEFIGRTNTLQPWVVPV